MTETRPGTVVWQLPDGERAEAMKVMRRGDVVEMGGRWVTIMRDGCYCLSVSKSGSWRIVMLFDDADGSPPD